MPLREVPEQMKNFQPFDFVQGKWETRRYDGQGSNAIDGNLHFRRVKESASTDHWLKKKALQAIQPQFAWLSTAESRFKLPEK